MRVLIVKLSSLGDLFHALPAVHCIRMHYKAEIHWAVQTEYEAIVRCFSDVARVISVPRTKIFWNARSSLGALREYEYDLIIDMQGLLKSGILARVARGKERIGPSFHREGASLFYDRVPERGDPNRHAVYQAMDILRMLGVPSARIEFPVSFPSLQVVGQRPKVALLPLSRWATKNWPPERFVEAARKLKEREPMSFFIVGSASDSSLCSRMEKEIGKGAVSMAGRLTLPALGGFLKQMDLLIANDSGPVHIAAAVGTPCVVVFGPTDPRRTGPYGQRHRMISAKLECQPCFSRTCRFGQPRCLLAVKPEQVVEAATKILR